MEIATRFLRRGLPTIRTVSNIRTVSTIRTASKYSKLVPAIQREYDTFLPRHLLHTSPCFNGEVVQFNLADIGEGIAEVLVIEWYVGVGDEVDQFDQICEVKSDKASVTITSRYKGVIKKLYYEVDEEANVGLPLIDIEIEGGESTEPVAKVPEQITASTEELLPPPAAVEQAIEPTIDPGYSQTISEPAPSARGRASTLCTPSVRKIAKENNIDLISVTGTGKDGRVLKEDLLKYIENQKKVMAAPKAAAAAAPPPPPPPPPQPIVHHVAKEDTVTPIKGIQRAMVNSMAQSLQIPHFGYKDEIDMSNLVNVRKELKGVCKERGIKLSYMPFFLKAASMALHKYPVLNSSLDLENMSLIQKANHNIGVAMDTKGGLLVPNIKSVQSKSVFEIAHDLNRLHALGLEGKLGMDDITNGTFSLSNIGSIGGTYAMPVIAPPEVAIGAVGKMQVLPRFDDNGDVVKARIMNVSWSADHRVVDGATMARFSNLWKSYLEQPTTMLVDLR